MRPTPVSRLNGRQEIERAAGELRGRRLESPARRRRARRPARRSRRASRSGRRSPRARFELSALKRNSKATPRKISAISIDEERHVERRHQDRVGEVEDREEAAAAEDRARSRCRPRSARPRTSCGRASSRRRAALKRMPTPRSKPSAMTYMATATAMSAGPDQRQPEGEAFVFRAETEHARSSSRPAGRGGRAAFEPFVRHRERTLRLLVAGSSPRTLLERLRAPCAAAWRGSRCRSRRRTQ